jgi:predicted nucleotidyltransferase
MPDKIYTIDEIKKIVEPIAREYGVGRLSLFGSYARGEARVDSDIDIRVVDGGKMRGLFKLAGLYLALEEGFGQKVDVVDCNPDAYEFLNEIKGDEVIIYDERTTRS